MSLEVNIDENGNNGIPSVSPSRARKFEMAIANKTSVESDTPSSANRGSRFNQIGNSNFLDFGKVSGGAKAASTTAMQEIDAKNNVTKSRFVNNEVSYVKEVHVEIQSVINDEAALHQDTAQNFTSMDLARLLNKVLINLNLQPSKDDVDQPINGPNSNRHWISNSPAGQEPTLQELKSTINMQNVMLSELGKSMQKISKYNSDLIEYNKKLISEKNNAVQARDDLLLLLAKEQKRKVNETEKERNKGEILRPHERQFFDEAAILDAAVEEFRKAQFGSTKADHPVNEYTEQRVSNIKRKERFSTSSEIVNVDEKLTSVRIKEIINNSDDKFVRSKDQNTGEIMKRNKNKSQKNLEISSPEPKDFQKLANQVNFFLETLNIAAKEWNKKVMEADSIEQYTALLEIKIKELTTSFKEVLQFFIESQSISKAWKIKFEEVKSTLTSLKLQNTKHSRVTVTPFPSFQAPPLPKEEKAWTFSYPGQRDSKTAYFPTLINKKNEFLL